jgi:hypothetical protein
MNPLSFLRGGVLLGALTGCGSDFVAESIDLAGLADRTLTYALNDVDVFEGASPTGAHRFTVLFSLAEGERCTQLREGVTATFNGAPMQLERGGIDDTAGRDVCQPTRAFFDFNAAVWADEDVEDARVELRDGTGAVTLVLQRGKAKRQFVFLGPGTRDRLSRGQTYTYLWQPGDEVPGSLAATLLREGGSAAATLPVSQEGGRLTFTLPATTSVADHLLTLSGTAAGRVVECSGVRSCEGTVFHSQQEVVIVE